MTGSGDRVLRVHVLPTTPGLPLLPVASLLGLGGGLGARSAADRRIFARAADSFAAQLCAEADATRADDLVHPHDALDHLPTAAAAAAQARGVGIPTAFFSTSDLVAPARIPWGTLWRTSGFRSRLLPHERVATGDVPDLREERTPTHPDALPWRPVPAIGFIGHVAGGWRSIGYLRRGWQNYHGFTLRERVLRAFEGSSLVQPQFVRRSANLGPPMAGVDGDEDRRRKRAEYVDSVFGCEYALCVRGAGNWSFRFFEALSAGRVPVVIDTDSVLPLEGEMDWSRHLCRVPVRMLADAPRIVAEFHARLGDEGFARMQVENRRLWEERLEPGVFLARALRGLADAPRG